MERKGSDAGGVIGGCLSSCLVHFVVGIALVLFAVSMAGDEIAVPGWYIPVALIAAVGVGYVGGVVTKAIAKRPEPVVWVAMGVGGILVVLGLIGMFMPTPEQQEMPAGMAADMNTFSLMIPKWVNLVYGLAMAAGIYLAKDAFGNQSAQVAQREYLTTEGQESSDDTQSDGNNG